MEAEGENPNADLGDLPGGVADPGEGDIAFQGDDLAFQGDGEAAVDVDLSALEQPYANPMASQGSMMSEGAGRRASLSKGQSSGRFMAPAVLAKCTRQQLIEYVSLQRWSWDIVKACPVVMLWLALTILVSLRSHSEASYALRATVTKHVTDIAAVSTRGVPPPRIMSEGDDEAETTNCACVCALRHTYMCDLGARPLNRSKYFEGEITMTQLATLRARSAYNRLILDGYKEAPLRWDDLRTLPDVYFWLQHGLIPDLWHEEGRHYPLDIGDMFGSFPDWLTQDVGPMASRKKAPPGQLLHWNKIIGGVRMRMRRFEEQTCRADSRISERYEHTCHGDEHSVRPFGPGTGSFVEGFMPLVDEKAFDVYMDVGMASDIILENFVYTLKQHNWLDAATDTLDVRAAFLNAEAYPPLFGLLDIHFKFQRSGTLTRSVQVTTTTADEYPSWFFWYLDLMWAVLVFCLALRQVQKAATHCFCPRRIRDHAWYFNFWTVLDWVTVGMSLFLMVLFSVLFMGTETLSSDVAALPDAPARGSSAEVMTAYHAKWGAVLDKVETAVQWRGYQRLLMFWYVIALTVQFVKVFRGQPKLAELARVVYRASEDVVHFVIIFLILFLNFAFAGFMIFGLRMEDWSTPIRAVNTTFKSLFGDTDLATMYEISPISTVAWYWLFISTMFFVLLNLLLSITHDHYKTVKAKAGGATGLWPQILFFVRDERARLGEMGWRSFFFSFSPDPAVPSHDIVLEELMARAGLGIEERRAIRGNVLGSKRTKKVREQTVFSGKESDDSQQWLAQSPAEPDLKEMGISRDYVDFLVEECDKYRLREYDPSDAKVMQLRELVCMAEDDVAVMRDRVEETHGSCKFAMKGLSRRLQSLEVRIHTTLQELSLIAGPAGVPDKAEKKVRYQKHDAAFDETVSSMRSSMRSPEPGARTGSMKRVMKHLHSVPTSVSPKSANVSAWTRALRSVDTKNKRTVKREGKIDMNSTFGSRP